MAPVLKAVERMTLFSSPLRPTVPKLDQRQLQPSDGEILGQGGWSYYRQAGRQPEETPFTSSAPREPPPRGPERPSSLPLAALTAWQD